MLHLPRDMLAVAERGSLSNLRAKEVTKAQTVPEMMILKNSPQKCQLSLLVTDWLHLGK
jgi:hypothetical protein